MVCGRTVTVLNVASCAYLRSHLSVIPLSLLFIIVTNTTPTGTTGPAIVGATNPRRTSRVSLSSSLPPCAYTQTHIPTYKRMRTGQAHTYTRKWYAVILYGDEGYAARVR
uniref:Uncharacterized protein n=1 Tax=Trypanosoma congolense (strain IL3000) TaxID=1068625 RepID=G0UQW5_TRYCI|nr:hypothetical protein, unlikely [Trypanosoma congolense IL3000]